MEHAVAVSLLSVWHDQSRAGTNEASEMDAQLQESPIILSFAFIASEFALLPQCSEVLSPELERAVPRKSRTEDTCGLWSHERDRVVQDQNRHLHAGTVQSRVLW